VTPVAGAKARAATWKLAGGGQGRVLDLDVTVGGPPCDAVTGVDVRESPTTVAVTVYAGPIPTADCRGVPAITGTVRVRVTLGEPLGSRRLITE
jgi:hypothetical protein